MGETGTQVKNQVQNRVETGCKTEAHLVQNQVQNRGKTRVSVFPHTPMVHWPSLKVGLHLLKQTRHR